MKKTLLFAAVILALAACSKESPIKEESVIDVSKLVFNIDVQNGNATKGVKTAWENGDKVYVFFEDNMKQYVKMTYDGTSWTYADKNGLTDFSDLILTASGKKLSALYMPDFVCLSDPFYWGASWNFGTISGYYQKAEGIEYTVTSTSDVNTLNATIKLTAPENISQIFIPEGEYAECGSGEEYVLTATHFTPFEINEVFPGGAISQINTDNGHPLSAYAGTLGGEKGLYFWGILEGEGTYDFDFQLVKRNSSKKYAISSYSKSVTGKTVPGSFAAKLTGLTDNGNFVSLGYEGGPLWATGNLDKTNSKIVDPFEAGEYFKYGKTAPYINSDPDYTGTDNLLPTSDDVAYSVNSTRRIPTMNQFTALINSTNTTTEWDTENEGLSVKSKVNGISLFFAAAGRYHNGAKNSNGVRGYYWSSTYDDTSYRSLYFYEGYCDTNSTTLTKYGQSIRPVKN